MLSPLAYLVVLLLVTFYAFMHGKVDERTTALICVVATFATMWVSSPFGSAFSRVETGVLIVDLVTLAGFTLVAVKSNRFWPLWVAGFQLTSTFAHALKAIHLDLLPQAYAVAERFWVYPIFLAIIVGTWRTHRRLLDQSAKPIINAGA